MPSQTDIKIYFYLSDTYISTCELSNYMGNVKFINKKCAKFMPWFPSLQAGKGSVKTPVLCQANCKKSP